MNSIEKLYYNMDKLNENWTDTPEVKAASDRLEEALGDELYAKYEDEICNCTAANHKEGFVKGFQYAISLLTGGKAVWHERRT